MRYCEQCLLYSAMIPPPLPTPPPEAPPQAPQERANMVDILAGKKGAGGPRNFTLATVARKTVAFGSFDEAVAGSMWTMAAEQTLSDEKMAAVQTLSDEAMAEIKQHFTKSLRRGVSTGGAAKVSLVTGMKVFALTLLIGFPNFPEFPDLPDSPCSRIDGWISCLLKVKFVEGFADTIQQILASWPTSDEEAAVKTFRGAPESLNLVDRFFYELRDIPLLKKKFETMHFRESFDKRAEWITTTINSVAGAVSELLASPRFVRAVVLVHEFGHVVNTDKRLSDDERAKGFPIGNLTKINEVKSYIRGTPMMEVFAHVLERDFPEIARFPSDLPSLPAVRSIPWAAALDDFRLLERGLKTIDEQLQAKLPFRIAPHLAEPLAQHRIVLEQARDEVAAKMATLRVTMARGEEAVANFNTFFCEPAATCDFAASLAAVAAFAVDYQAVRDRVFAPPPPPVRTSTPTTEVVPEATGVH